MMNAVYFETNLDTPRFSYSQAPRPRPEKQDLLIQVHAAGLIRAELGWNPTLRDKDGAPRMKAIPCHEFSGVVVGVGEEVGKLEIGREVYGMNDWYSQGALAEFCTAPFACVAPKPEKLNFLEAASVPISALTAWQGLFDRADLQPGEHVLIHGGMGAVGLFAVQLAKQHGARVTATASASNLQAAYRLGADCVIDYGAKRFEDEVSGVDVVFDTVGGETLARSWSILKPGGRLVTIVSADGKDSKVHQAFFIVQPNQKQLYSLTAMFDSGRLHTVIDSVVPLERASEVYAGTFSRRGRGKVVINIASTAHAAQA